MPEPVVVHRPANDKAGSGVFAIEAGGKELGFLDYTRPDAGTICIEYVEVAPAMRGRDLGKRLVDAAVSWARGERRKVSATCGFARAVLDATAEYQDVRLK